MLHNESEGNRSKIVKLLAIVLVGIVLGLWHNRQVARGKSDFVTSSVRTVISPFVYVTHSVGGWFANQTSWLFRGKSLADENKRLKDENARLQFEVSTLRESDISLKRLRSQLGFAFALAAGTKRVPAEVIAHRPIPGYATLMISLGAKDGIGMQSVVVAPGGLVGQVIDVAYNSSIVLLLSDQNSAVGAMVQRPESRAIGVCKMDSNGTMNMLYVEREADVKVGDVVITSGLGGEKGVFPKGIPIGAVTSVSDDASGSTRRIGIKPAVEYYKLEEVYILQ